MLKGILIFILGNILAWFSLHLQFLSEWWRENPLFTVILFSMPIGFLFLTGTRILVESAGYFWASRIIGFSISTIIYSVLTWIVLKESFLEPKTLICLFLSIIILCIQVFWKESA
jgi:hypothetical protein|tara:strand:- start:1145 stop:1489 length:345 start_codon:yes stop_codon:yes gene_type:complete